MKGILKKAAYAGLWPVAAAAGRVAPVVLLYHSFDREGWRYGVAPENLRRQLAYLAAHYDVVPLADIVAFVRGEKAFARPTVALTVDDGYADTHEVLFPLAKKHRMSFTVFLTSNFSVMEKLGNLPRITPSQVREMHDSGLAAFGVHGKNHRNFPALRTDKEWREEVEENMEDIARLTGVRPRFAAYPAGRHTGAAAARLRALGIEAAWTTREDVTEAGMDPLRLPRVQVARATSMIEFKARLTRAVRWYETIVRLLRLRKPR